MVIKNIKTPRSFPIIKEWTTELLRDRETAEILHGGFGMGYPRDGPEFLNDDDGKNKTRACSPDCSAETSTQPTTNDDSLLVCKTVE